MTLPRTLIVGPYRYKVSVVQHPLGGYIYGETCHSDATIKLNAAQSPETMQETLMHEALHVIFLQTGLINQPTSDDEELLIRRLSPALTDLLQRNPKFVDYLTSRS